MLQISNKSGESWWRHDLMIWHPFQGFLMPSYLSSQVCIVFQVCDGIVRGLEIWQLLLSVRDLPRNPALKIPPLSARTYTYTYAPEVVYGNYCAGFLHCNCQTVNPGKQTCINLVKLIHKLLHLRSLLIVEKGTFNVLVA